MSQNGKGGESSPRSSTCSTCTDYSTSFIHAVFLPAGTKLSKLSVSKLSKLSVSPELDSALILSLHNKKISFFVVNDFFCKFCPKGRGGGEGKKGNQGKKVPFFSLFFPLFFS